MMSVVLPCHQIWPWRRWGSLNALRRKPPTWRLAPSPPPSPSQRQPWHPAPAADRTAPRLLPSPPKLRTSCQCPRTDPGRSPLQRRWHCPIRAAGIPSSSCPAFSPGTPVRSPNETRTAPLWKPLQPVSRCLPSTKPPQPARVMETSHCPGHPCTSAGVTVKPAALRLPLKEQWGSCISNEKPFKSQSKGSWSSLQEIPNLHAQHGVQQRDAYIPASVLTHRSLCFSSKLRVSA